MIEKSIAPKISQPKAKPRVGDVHPENLDVLEQMDAALLAEVFAAITAPPPQPYVVLVFQSRLGKNEFLRTVKWGEEDVTSHVDGWRAAETFGIAFSRAKVALPKPGISLQRNTIALKRPTLTLTLNRDVPIVEDAPAATEGDDDEAFKKLKKSAEREKQNFMDTVDTLFWLAINFDSDADYDLFLEKTGWGDLLSGRYLCGEDVAAHMGIVMTTPIPKMPNWSPPRRLVALQGSMT